MTQNFIVKFTDDSMNMITFERFAYKRLTTVKKAVEKLWNNSLYRACTKEATQAVIIHTPYEGCERLVDIINLKGVNA